ncbi:hypothetical protein PILCRDRAFT_823163 [Piloderma croceum F 1598]|uniref:DUF6593 domain-containing protein n=1 Tax=Piloderma croceum (strain F 1598) TaxID=765440 RepID=A0A0C3FJL8_PILCF|nr:hypothetical protein PILCRDRAFT_823163 [Piloderma croceum F 1598]
MELIFSRNDPINTIITTTEGHVLYKIETPGTDIVLPGKSTTIKGIAPDVTNNALEIDTQDRIRELAVIDWHLTESSKLRYDGMELDLSEFLPPEGSLGLVGRPRVFQAPGGISYKWSFGMVDVPVLRTNDESNKIIARFRRQRFGLIGKASHASLEILPGSGEHIQDLIVITFIYVEMLRRKRQRGFRVIGFLSGA